MVPPHATTDVRVLSWCVNDPVAGPSISAGLAARVTVHIDAPRAGRRKICRRLHKTNGRHTPPSGSPGTVMVLVTLEAGRGRESWDS